MAYTVPTTRSTDDLITASIWNTDMVDNIIYLKSAVSANIFISAAGMWTTLTNGATTGGVIELSNGENIRYVSFPDGSITHSECGLIMPADYDGGVMTAKFYWTHPATTTNFGVRWGIRGSSFGDGEALDAAYSSVVGASDTGGTTSTLYISPASSNMTVTGTPAAGEFVQLRFSRIFNHADDTMAVAAYLLGVLITYTRT